MALTAAQKSNLSKGGGALAGAGLGFLVGGPIGALVGGGAGLYLGNTLAPPKPATGDVSDKVALAQRLALVAAIKANLPPPQVVNGRKVIPLKLGPTNTSPPPANVAGDFGAEDVEVTTHSVATPKEVKQAATQLNCALQTNGYKKADMPVYMAFQHVAGLPVTGRPDENTIKALAVILTQNGEHLAAVQPYRWDIHGKYDGANAPTAEEWLGDKKWHGHALPIAYVDAYGLPSTAHVIAMTPLPPNAHIISIQDAQRALNMLRAAQPPLSATNVLDPPTVRALTQYQQRAGLHPSGNLDTETTNKLQADIAAL